MMSWVDPHPFIESIHTLRFESIHTLLRKRLGRLKTSLTVHTVDCWILFVILLYLFHNLLLLKPVRRQLTIFSLSVFLWCVEIVVDGQTSNLHWHCGRLLWNCTRVWKQHFFSLSIFLPDVVTWFTMGGLIPPIASRNRVIYKWYLYIFYI